MPWVPVSTGSQPSSPSSGNRQGRTKRHSRHKTEEEQEEEAKDVSPLCASVSSDSTFGQQLPHAPVGASQDDESHRTGTWADMSLDASDGETPYEAWPRTPSSRSRSPSPCPMQAQAPQFVMAAMPMAPMGFAPHAMLPVGFGGIAGNCTEQWVAEVRTMALRMQMLASVAPPSLDDCVTDSGTMTDAIMEHVDCWEAAAIYLCNIQAEADAFEEKAGIAESAARSMETDCSSAQAELQTLSDQLAAREAVQLERHRVAAAAVAAAQQIVSKSREALAATKSAIAKRAMASSDCMASLRLELDVQVTACKEAQQKVTSARTEQAIAKDLPALKSRQEAAEARFNRLTKDCAQVRQQVDALRTEIDSVVQGGSGTRADTLEALVSQLESDCRDLQQGDAVEAGNIADLGEENRCLLVEVREARSERDEAQTTASTLEEDVRNLRARMQSQEDELAHVNAQIRSEAERRDVLKEEMEARRAHIRKFEQRSREIDSEMKAIQQKKRMADKDLESLEIARRKNKSECDTLEWKFQEVMRKMEKSKPNDPLGKMLMRSGLRDMTYRTKRRPKEQTDGSDVGSESVDADVSTTCGESSTVDNLLD